MVYYYALCLCRWALILPSSSSLCVLTVFNFYLFYMVFFYAGIRKNIVKVDFYIARRYWYRVPAITWNTKLTVCWLSLIEKQLDVKFLYAFFIYFIVPTWSLLIMMCFDVPVIWLHCMAFWYIYCIVSLLLIINVMDCILGKWFFNWSSRGR